ncbi:MAG: DPP IV N-terminal domain-containing protein [Ferruginibacter sp.]
MKVFIKVFVIVILFLYTDALFAQGNIKWSADGKAYYANEKGVLVKYTLPSFERTELLQASQLTPSGKTVPLPVKDFSFSDEGNKILIYTNSKKVWRRETRGDYWILNKADFALRQVGKNMPESSLMFAKISPDGKQVAYVSGHNIYTEDIVTGAATQLTTDGTDRIINGTFDWAYEEEFGCRDGFRWSPDSKSIAYWQIDARDIRNFLMINNTDSIYSFVVPVEYPKVGQDPSACKVGVVSIASKQTTWMNVPGDTKQHYIPRMEWADNSSEIVLEQLNRKQNEAGVFICNAQTGTANLIYTETDKAWIDTKGRWSNEPVGWEWLNNGKDFLWVSEKDGWRHIFLISRDGKKQTLLTNGNYDITRIEAIDENSGYIYFMASPDNATQLYLYRIALKGKGKLELISPSDEKGTHRYNISPTGLYASHDFSNHLNQRLSEWVSLPKHVAIKTTTDQMTVPPLAAGRNPVEMFQLTTEDGVTMDGWMVKPVNFDSSKKYPVLFSVYSEPAATTVKDVAGIGNNRLYVGDMAADGYIQISVDGRGTPAPKGAAWRKAIYQNIGIINIRDQAMAAKIVRQWPYVDSNRIAVQGWSGGGSTTLNLLFQYPQYYQTGIAIAPVANQLLYDNIYQERYMGLPQENPEPFKQGSPITHAKNLQGNLLVIHGTGDDNVHYQGTEQLINELVKDGKQFQMMSYPNRTHSINEGTGTSEHLAKLFTTYLNEHCPGGGR